MPTYQLLPPDLDLPPTSKGGEAFAALGRDEVAVLAGTRYEAFRLARFDAALRPLETEQVAAEGSRLHVLRGGTWAEDRPAFWVWKRGAVVASPPPGPAPWVERGQAAARAALAYAACLERVIELNQASHLHCRGLPRDGAVLASGELLVGGCSKFSNLYPPYTQLHLLRPDGVPEAVHDRLLGAWAARREHAPLSPHLLWVAASGGRRLAFAGCGLLRSGSCDHALGIYDLDAEDLVALNEELPWKANAAQLAHDAGRGRTVVRADKAVRVYDAELQLVAEATATQSPFVSAWQLLAGHADGRSLWLNRRSRALALLKPGDLDGDLPAALTRLHKGFAAFKKAAR